MTVQNSDKDLNFGQIFRKIRKEKKIILPPLKDWQVEMLVEDLDWYTNHILFRFPSLSLEQVRDRISIAITNREIRYRDIQEMKFKEKGETA